MAVKTGEDRLKEMEAEMALFEQEVLGAPVSGPSVTDEMEVEPELEPEPEEGPVAVAMPTEPVIRAIIGTNTYRQVQQSLEARAAAFVVPPPCGFVGPGMPPHPPSVMRPAFVPHILQRPGGHRMPMMRGPPPQSMVAPPMPRPPPPPPMMMRPPMPGPPQHHMGNMGPMSPGVGMAHMVPVPRPVMQAPPKMSPTVIQAAPTVYTAAPVSRKQEGHNAARQARVEELLASVAQQQAALALMEEKEASAALDESVIGPSMPEQEPVHAEALEGSSAEDRKKSKQEKAKRCIRTAAGTSWEDQSLLEWDTDDFRIFCGDLGNEVNDDILTRAFGRYPSFLKAKVVRDKRTGKTKGYGFVSFKDPNDYVRAMREMNGKYVGSRPIKLRKSTWKDRNIEVVRKKQKDKKKLGLR
ncbi:RNA-binding protein 42 [Polyodon spathula]|uniref:RNA-binding protein 42 n=1 Tax=Polyodon spathula TaxID=7913 RepID=UPI001B7EA5A1|nr:RNA-binding protein 42 [Polyodon spathula]